VKILLILQGLSGSGKTSFAREYAEVAKKQGENVIIASADHYFESEVDGTYNFKPEDLGKAHKACQEKVAWGLLSRQVNTVIVDNTNTTLNEVRTYYDMGKKAGVPISLVRFDCSLETALERNVHRVPKESLEKMKARLETFQIPEDWEMGTSYFSS